MSKLASCFLALCLAACSPDALEGRDALWTIVHGSCVAHQADRGTPEPCVLVDQADGYAVLKDKRGVSQYLLIPTARVTGIEDKSILLPDAPNYFVAAWKARSYVEAALHRSLPREDVGLAVNSETGRSQDQLHIHIDCLRADVRDMLRAHASEISQNWTPLPVALVGHTYFTRQADLAANPFRLLAEGLQGARGEMGHYSLAAVEETFPDGTEGFILLADRASPTDRASSSELLDHSCEIVK